MDGSSDNACVYGASGLCRKPSRREWLRTRTPILRRDVYPKRCCLLRSEKDQKKEFSMAGRKGFTHLCSMDLFAFASSDGVALQRALVGCTNDRKGRCFDAFSAEIVEPSRSEISNLSGLCS